jgi:hypothetical protein
MSSVPTQIRTVDPFASYNSDIVNRLTRMVTRLTDGSGVLNSPNDLQVYADATSTTKVEVQPGIVFKDDMLIHITQEHTVDFEDSDNYVSFGGGFNEAGYYYICVEYTFVKSRPAPEAEIKIIKPSQRVTTFQPSSSLVFIKCVDVIFNGLTFEVSTLYDYDPDDVTVKREFTKWYLSGEVFLPTFDRDRDEGRLVYVTTDQTMWLGTDTQWVQFGALKITALLNSWTISGGSYYADINIAPINSNYASVTLQDSSDGTITIPEEIDFTSTTNIRIWMPVNTVNLRATVIG